MASKEKNDDAELCQNEKGVITAHPVSQSVIDNAKFDLIGEDAERERLKRIAEGFMEKINAARKDTQKSDDSVNHPAHYNSHPSGIECIEIARHYDFCIGNAIKYLWRCGLKQDADKTPRQKEIEDLRKAIWYIQDRINQLEHEPQ